MNLTVWESLDALKAFAYRGIHRDFFKRRAEWFVEGSTRTALWWLRRGALPTTEAAMRRLQFLEALGPSPYAFSMDQHHPVLVIDQLDSADIRREHPSQKLGGRIGDATNDLAGVVVAELDDVAIAGGGYLRVDDTTAEIRRMYVDASARGMRVGVALVAELAAAARSDGVERLLLETTPRHTLALQAFGFGQCPAPNGWASTGDSVVMEKTLTG